MRWCSAWRWPQPSLSPHPHPHPHPHPPPPPPPPRRSAPVVGHVYVNDNTAGANTIGAFDRHADGTLTPRPGPRSRGRCGHRHGLASQGALQISADGRFLLAVDAGSNQISVLRIRPNGSLSLVPGGVVSSGGVLPVSIAVHGHLVYVANAGTGGSNYTGFRLSPCGHLPRIAGLDRGAARRLRSPATCCSTAPAPSWSAPGSGTSQIDSFTVGSDGRLTAAPGSPFSGPRPGPVRQRVPPHQPGPALRVQRPQRRQDTAPSRPSATPPRQPVADRILAVPRPADRPVLGGDQPRRPVPVHRQHRLRHDLPLLDRPPRQRSLCSAAPRSAAPASAPSTPGSAPAAAPCSSTRARGAVAAFAVHGGTLTELASSPTPLPAGATPAGIVVS